MLKKVYFDTLVGLANSGDIRSQADLGLAHLTGLCGAPLDKVQAAHWFRKAAEQGLAEAQWNLGLCYLNGIGVAKDSEQALAWFGKAAGQGHAKAQHAVHELADGTRD